MGRRALYRQRRQGRARARRSGNRRSGAAARRRDRHPCAVRGIETRGRPRRRRGHREGADRRGAVVLAGGAWSRLPAAPRNRAAAAQGPGHGDAHRSAEGGPKIVLGGGLFGFRKRMDGGYRVATGVGHRPRPRRLPPLSSTTCRPRGCIGRSCDSASAGPGSRSGGPRRWRLDGPRPSKGCACSTRNPTIWRDVRAALTGEAFPAFRNGAVAESWGGMIDVMPDAMPVISPMRRCRAFLSRPAFPAMASGSAPARASWSPTWSLETRLWSTQPRSACRGSPTAPTRGLTRWPAEAADFR